MTQPIQMASSDWRKENHMIRIHCPTNGDVRDIQVTVDDVLVTLGNQVSFSTDRNDVYFPLKKTYIHRDMNDLVEMMRDLSEKQDGLARVYQANQELIVRQQAAHKQSADAANRRIIRLIKWGFFFLFVLIGGVAWSILQQLDY